MFDLSVKLAATTTSCHRPALVFDPMAAKQAHAGVTIGMALPGAWGTGRARSDKAALAGEPAGHGNQR